MDCSKPNINIFNKNLFAAYNMSETVEITISRLMQNF